MFAPSTLIVSGASLVDSIRKRATALEVAILAAQGKRTAMKRVVGCREDDCAAMLHSALTALESLEQFVSLARRQLAETIADPFGFEKEEWTPEEILRREG